MLSKRHDTAGAGPSQSRALYRTAPRREGCQAARMLDGIPRRMQDQHSKKPLLRQLRLARRFMPTCQ